MPLKPGVMVAATSMAGQDASSPRPCKLGFQTTSRGNVGWQRWGSCGALGGFGHWGPQISTALGACSAELVLVSRILLASALGSVIRPHGCSKMPAVSGLLTPSLLRLYFIICRLGEPGLCSCIPCMQLATLAYLNH